MSNISYSRSVMEARRNATLRAIAMRSKAQEQTESLLRIGAPTFLAVFVLAWVLL